MDALRAVMLNVLVIVFLTTVLDLLLPDGTMRRYVKMTMGFFVVLTLLQPVMQLVQPEGMLQQWQLSLPTLTAEGSMPAQGDVYARQRQQMEQLYAEKLEEQVASLLLLATSLEDFTVDCTVKEQCLQQIRIGIPAGTAVDRQRPIQALSGYYGIGVGQIQIETEEAESDELEGFE